MEGARHFAVALGAGAFKLPTVADLVRAIADQDVDERKGVLVACARSTWRAGSDDDDAGDGDEEFDCLLYTSPSPRDS